MKQFNEGSEKTKPVKLSYVSPDVFSRLVSDCYQVKHINQIKKNRYLEALSMYGIYVVCYLLDCSERAENYEECEVILSAIREYNEITGELLPSRLSDIGRNTLLKSIKRFNMAENDYLDKVEAYAEQVRRDVGGLNPVNS